MEVHFVGQSDRLHELQLVTPLNDLGSSYDPFIQEGHLAWKQCITLLDILIPLLILV